MNKKNRGKCRGVAIHDGQAWRLLSGDDMKERIAPIPGPADKLPQTLVDQAVSASCRSIRFLVSGDVHRMEGAIPGGMSLDGANDVIRESIGEATGVEANGLLVAGLSMTWGGVRKPFTLAGKFDGDMVEDFHAALAEAGVGCAGFASLEQAMLAVWKDSLDGNLTPFRDREGRNMPRPPRNASLVIVGAGQSFLVPGPRGANSGPQTVACGLRHFSADPSNWLARFQRAMGGIDREAPLRVVAMSGLRDGIVFTLVAAGYRNATGENADDWMAAAARVASLAKPNRTQGVSVPVVNPYEPRKKFSHGWLVAVALAILVLPAVFRWTSGRLADARCRRIAMASARYRPLEDKIKKAKKALAAAEREKANELAAQRERIAARRPLVSFIDVAYFFCKHSGESLTLESIEQRGDRIEVRGTFSDPEDGVRLNKGMLEYARQKNIEVEKNESVNEAGGDSSFVSRFAITLNCGNVGREASR
ncbi:MAG: hypothetical protein IKQ17_07640 [Kiritimatiellae bacterium]|nr:hypothetical protein [Kiritimatiellia bacterium]